MSDPIARFVAVLSLILLEPRSPSWPEPPQTSVEQLLATANDLAWQQAEAVGDGDEYRAESKRGRGSVIVYADMMLGRASARTRALPLRIDVPTTMI